MTETERYQKRRAYFAAYGKANRAKRREAQRRWRSGIGQAAYNERQAAYARAHREANGTKSRARSATVKQVLQVQPKPIITGEGLRERFLAYRKSLRQ